MCIGFHLGFLAAIWMISMNIYPDSGFKTKKNIVNCKVPFLACAMFVRSTGSLVVASSE
jgi:hypothetical protein